VITASKRIYPLTLCAYSSRPLFRAIRPQLIGKAAGNHVLDMVSIYVDAAVELLGELLRDRAFTGAGGTGDG
jgi:hypothetical protein